MRMCGFDGGLVSSVKPASQIVVGGVAAYFIFNGTKPDAKIASLNGQVASLTSQLEDSQKEIAELRGRTMPITLRIDRDAINAGYNLYVYNQARTSLRFHYMVRGNEVRGSKITRAVDVIPPLRAA